MRIYRTGAPWALAGGRRKCSVMIVCNKIMEKMFFKSCVSYTIINGDVWIIFIER